MNESEKEIKEREEEEEEEESWVLHAVGHVESSATESQHRTKEAWAAHECAVVVAREYAEAAAGLGAYCATVWVVFGIDRLAEEHLATHPRGDRTREPRGCFSVSTPARPNHLGVTEAALVAQTLLPDGRVRLTVRGLDALDGSPVFDLKPGARTPYAEAEVASAAAAAASSS